MGLPACLPDRQLDVDGVGDGDRDGDGNEAGEEDVEEGECKLWATAYCTVDGRQIVIPSFRFVFYDISSLAAHCGRADRGWQRGEQWSVGQRNHFILLTVVTKIAHCLQTATAFATAAAFATTIACRLQQSRPSGKFTAERRMVKSSVI